LNTKHNSFVRAQVVAEMQKTETKNSKAKDVFEKVKTDIRLMKEELNLIDR
jgi:structural maintenance of chromosome 3 (chondroitin sulfate proteoglycan 6)